MYEGRSLQPCPARAEHPIPSLSPHPILAQLGDNLGVREQFKHLQPPALGHRFWHFVYPLAQEPLVH